MRGDKPMTGQERQANYRKRLKVAGHQTTIDLSPEAVTALAKIRAAMDSRGYSATKRFAIESALIWYSKKA